MITEDEFFTCEFCKKGPLIKRVEAMKFRQWSVKGYVHCSALIPVSVCDFCGALSFEPETDRILDEAFQRECNKVAVTQ